MPLYEYSCRQCGRQFEVLMRAGVTPACPACRAEDVEKIFSVFAVGAQDHRQAPTPAGGPCATCQHAGGPGSCAYNN